MNSNPWRHPVTAENVIAWNRAINNLLWDLHRDEEGIHYEESGDLAVGLFDAMGPLEFMEVFG